MFQFVLRAASAAVTLTYVDAVGAGPVHFEQKPTVATKTATPTQKVEKTEKDQHDPTKSKSSSRFDRVSVKLFDTDAMTPWVFEKGASNDDRM